MCQLVPFWLKLYCATAFFSFRDVSSYMKTHNVVGTSKGYVNRVVASYSTVTPEKVRKYFWSAMKFVNLYIEGETGFSVNKRMAEMRKSHRGPAQFEVEHSKKNYNRNRLD